MRCGVQMTMIQFIIVIIIVIIIMCIIVIIIISIVVVVVVVVVVVEVVLRLLLSLLRGAAWRAAQHVVSRPGAAQRALLNTRLALRCTAVNGKAVELLFHCSLMCVICKCCYVSVVIHCDRLFNGKAADSHCTSSGY